jgi:OFA family oxalate/formate antiporter-like MFS transporter
MMRVLGIAFLVVVVLLAQVLRAPHKALQFVKGLGHIGDLKNQTKQREKKADADFTPKEMLGTHGFYLLWFMYACGAGAGLMIIAKLAAIAKVQVGIELGFLLVAVLAVGNGGGRIVAGMVSDKLGRKATLFICFLFQAALIFLLSRATRENFLGSAPAMAVLSALVGANYGANLSLFPSITKDYYGLKNFGMNYGLVFTAWGVGGFMLALLAGKMYDATQTFNVAYYGASGLLIVAAIVTLLVRPPAPKRPVAS